MGDLWFRARKPGEGRAYSVAEWKGAAAAYVLVVLSMLGLVIPPVVGHGSLLSFGIAAVLFLTGIVGFLEILKRSSDWED